MAGNQFTLCYEGISEGGVLDGSLLNLIGDHNWILVNNHLIILTETGITN